LEITPPVPGSLKELDFSYNKISTIVLGEYWSLTHINLSRTFFLFLQSKNENTNKTISF
jgi:hypothetical protein